MFKKIYERLNEEGLDVYAIGRHTGLCKSPYVVVKNDARRPFLTGLNCELWDVIIFCPIERYSALDGYLSVVKRALKPLRQLKFTGQTTPVVIDDAKKAYTCSLKYQIYKRRDV